MSSVLAKTLIAFVATGGVVAGTVAGVMNSKDIGANSNSKLQAYGPSDQEGNSNPYSLVPQDVKSEVVQNSEKGDGEEFRTTEIKNSEKLGDEMEAKVNVSGGDKDINEIPKEQFELQQEKDSSRDDSPENQLEDLAPSQVVVPEGSDQSPIESIPLGLPAVEIDLELEQTVENGGHFIFELDSESDGYAQDEWEIEECEMIAENGKVIISCHSNYASDGKKITFYINSSSINSKKYDFKKLTELSWMPYGSGKSDLTLTFDGKRNLVVELVGVTKA